MNKYVINNTTKFIQRKEIKCFLCKKQKKNFLFDLNNEKIFYINNKKYFSSSSFISTTTSISSSSTILTNTPIMTTTTTTTTISPEITTTTTTSNDNNKQIEITFKLFKQLVETKIDELNNIENFPKFTNLLIKELIGSGIDNEMKSIMWIYDKFENNNNLLTFETKHLIILELLKYKQKKKAIIIMEKLLLDNNYIPDSSIIHEMFDNFKSYDNNDLNMINMIKNLFNIIIKKDIHQLEYLKLYTRMIELECSNFNIDNALIYFKEMKEIMGIKPDNISYLALINGFAKMNMMNKAEEYFDLMIKEEISPTIEIFTTLINHYLRLLNIEKCEYLFQIMKSYNVKPNIYTYNVIIHNSVINLDMETANKFFNEIIESGIRPDIVTFSTLLKGYLNIGDIFKALEINKMLHEFRDFGIQPNNAYNVLLMKVYIQNKDFVNAEKVFLSIINSNIKSLTLYLKILLQKSRDKNSIYELYKRFLEDFDNFKYKFPPDNYFFTIFISSFAQKYHDMNLAIELFEEMKKREIKPSIVTYSILIDGFALKGQVDKAVEYFENLKKDSIEPNAFTYTSLIKAWVQVNNKDNAKNVYNEMISKNIQPVSATLRALQNLDHSPNTNQRNLIKRATISQKEALYWASKLWISKDIEAVDRLFQSFLSSISNSFPYQDVDEKPNVKTFRYFITCYLFKYRDLSSALDVFREMLKLNIKPDYLLYCDFIKGCCMLGQVEKSIQFIEMMKNQNFVPNDYIYFNITKGWKKLRNLKRTQE
jgi:pentatricopeptide repeat protein